MLRHRGDACGIVEAAACEDAAAVGAELMKEPGEAGINMYDLTNRISWLSA